MKKNRKREKKDVKKKKTPPTHQEGNWTNQNTKKDTGSFISGKKRTHTNPKPSL